MNRISIRITLLLLGLCGAFQFIAQADTSSTLPTRVIVLDAGHGGKDPGNLGTQRYSTSEKDVVLDVTLKLGAYLEEKMPRAQVVYTRKSDAFIPLKKRAEIANDAQGDLFVSIHCDAFSKSSVHGATSLVLGRSHGDENRIAIQENSAILLEENYEEKYQGFDPNNPQSMIALTLYQDVYLDQSVRFAKRVQDQFSERVSRRNRGVKQQPLYVTSRTAMPAVLVELGFLTNPREEDFLRSEKGQTYMASAIFRAIRNYFSEQDQIAEEQAGSGARRPKLDQGNSSAMEEQEKSPSPGNIQSNESSPRGERATALQSKDTQYAIQILTSASLKNRNEGRLSNLPEVALLEENGLYKYYLPAGTSYSKAQSLKKRLRENGFPGAFVIGIRQGQKIPASKARELLE